jgi:superfamily II DNA helicase RecQ
MNVLLSLLQKSTDYNQLLKAVEAKQAVAVSGLSQAPRSHVLAAAHEQSGSPLVAVCQDDMAAKRPGSMQELLEVSGVGHVKAERYGAAFLNEIRHYTHTHREES